MSNFETRGENIRIIVFNTGGPQKIHEGLWTAFGAVIKLTVSHLMGEIWHSYAGSLKTERDCTQEFCQGSFICKIIMWIYHQHYTLLHNSL